MSVDLEENIKKETKEKIELPKKYKVFLHNDNYTPFDFVIEVLVSIFSYTPSKAMTTMLKVHNSGMALIGVYTKDIAETLVFESNNMSRENGHPLQCTMECE